MRAYFNDYVTTVFPARRAAAGADWRWPGDEWADETLQAATWRWIADHAPTPLDRVVELGAGAGKYTEKLLRCTRAEVAAYDISDAFIECLQRRCAGFIAEGRLVTHRIDWTDNEGLLRRQGWSRNVDMVIGIDVLMMMDFQSALVYLASAAALLRPGGRLLATFADGGTQSGLARMLRDLGRHSASDDAPCTRFHWISRDLLEFVLPQLGFAAPLIVHGPAEGLDIARLYVAAELASPTLGEEAAARLKPSGGDSTNRTGSLA